MESLGEIFKLWDLWLGVPICECVVSGPGHHDELCVNICVWVHVPACVPVHIGQRTTLDVIPQASSVMPRLQGLPKTNKKTEFHI